MIEDPAGIAGEIARHELLLNGAAIGKEAFVEAIAIHHHPTEHVIQAGNKRLRVPLDPGQAHARAEQDGIRCKAGQAL